MIWSPGISSEKESTAWCLHSGSRDTPTTSRNSIKAPVACTMLSLFHLRPGWHCSYLNSNDNRRWDKTQAHSHQLSGTSASASLSEISSWISSVFPESLLATELKEGEFLPPLIIRRQVSICTSRPLFMLHISMYSCRCRVMSLFAVASSIWRNINMISWWRVESDS